MFINRSLDFDIASSNVFYVISEGAKRSRQLENLFTILFKYRKEENRFTSAMFFFLKRLWEKEKDHQCCAKLLKALCSAEIEISDDLKFKLQDRREIHGKTNDKRKILPDLVICSVEPSKQLLILLEIKDEAKAKKSQVDDYIEYLREQKNKYRTRRLVLLSHHQPALDTIRDSKLQSKVSWSRLFILLKGLKGEVNNKVNVFILDSLINYLKEKGMVDLTTITEQEFERGFKQFASFLAMLSKAVEECFPSKLESIEPDFDNAMYLGYSFSKKPYISVGICVKKPGELRMYANKGGISNQKLGRALSNGIVKEDNYYHQIYAYRSLSNVYAESDPYKQTEKIKEYITEMHQNLKNLRGK